MYKIILIILLILFLIFLFEKSNFELFENNSKIKVVVSRYNEKLDWLTISPFNQYPYIVYNKGVNSDFIKTDKFEKEIKLPNVGRESHTYLSYIIENYDNSLPDFSIFVPGSVDTSAQSTRIERAKKMFVSISSRKENQDVFSCVNSSEGVLNSNKDFILNEYLSTDPTNQEINNSSEIKISDIRPFGSWYESMFNNANMDDKCFVQNSMFGLTKKTILNKPKDYYENLLKQVNQHNNHETVHYFERSWKTVFYPYENVLDVY